MLTLADIAQLKIRRFQPGIPVALIPRRVQQQVLLQIRR